MTSSPMRNSPRIDQREHRFTVLLGTIIGLMILGPALEYLPFSTLMYPVLGALIPLAAIYAVSGNRRHLAIGLALGLPAVGASILHSIDVGFGFPWVTLLFPPVFYAYTVWIVGKQVFTAPVVKTDTLAGAGCVYLLIGMTWWFLFLTLESLAPGSIGGRPPGVGNAEDRFDLLYYSFVTLTTLGFGDMAPLTRAARALTVVEATTGVLYLGIVIARLVGVYAAQTLHEEELASRQEE